MDTEMEDSMGNQPTHKVFFVQDINKPDDAGDKKPFWRQIGVAWQHRRSKGFSMKLDLIPADFTAGELVVLEANEEPEDLADAA